MGLRRNSFTFTGTYPVKDGWNQYPAIFFLMNWTWRVQSKTLIQVSGILDIQCIVDKKQQLNGVFKRLWAGFKQKTL